MSDQNPASDRDHFIPVRKIDVLEAVVADGAVGGDAERQRFRELCRLLRAILHQRFFDRLERLRNDYFYFSPDVNHQRDVDAATIEKAYRELIETLVGV